MSLRTPVSQQDEQTHGEEHDGKNVRSDDEVSARDDVVRRDGKLAGTVLERKSSSFQS